MTRRLEFGACVAVAAGQKALFRSLRALSAAVAVLGASCSDDNRAKVAQTEPVIPDGIRRMHP